MLQMNWSCTEHLIKGTRFPGSRQPSVSHCSILTMADVAFMRSFSLFEERPGNELATVATQGMNDCGAPVTPAAGCDENVINIQSYFPAIFEFDPYIGQAPIAVMDDETFSNGSAQTYDVLSNDILGDAALNLSSVEIVLQPEDGIAVVNTATGEIIVTMDTSETFATVYYRVRDVNGNLSTIGELNLSDGSML